MSALVTGGAGFIGSNLVDRLSANGLKVTVLDDLSSGREENLTSAIASGVELVRADVADSEGVVGVFERVRPKFVFHLAAQAKVNESVSNPLEDARVNLLGTLSVLEASRITGVGRFIYVSTGGAMYGEAEDYPTPETAAVRPESPYGASKYAAESYVSMYVNLHGLSTYTLRLANIYGPRQVPHAEGGVVAIFSELALAGRSARINGDGEQTRDFVAVSDVVDALLLAANSTVTGSCNIGRGKETSINQLAETLGSLVPDGLACSHGPARGGEVRRSVLDPAKAFADLGWRAEVGLQEGLSNTLDHFRLA